MENNVKVYNYEKVIKKVPFEEFLGAFLEQTNLVKLKDRVTRSLNIPKFNDELVAKLETILMNCKANDEVVYAIVDYDMDGIGCGTILKRIFAMLGIKLVIIVPDRFKDGYGMNKNQVQRAYDAGCKTLITADNGIVAFEAIDYAKSLGMTVIVTDHHRPADKLPNADLIFNTQIEGISNVQAKNICGTSTLFFLFRDILRRNFAPDIFIEQLAEYAGLATISDQMELEYENLKLVKFLNSQFHFNKNRAQSLKYLMNKQFADPYTITMTDWNFKIIPCLNATGRLETAETAINFLTEEKPEKIVENCEHIIALNDMRKEYSRKYSRLAINYYNQIDPERKTKVSVVLIKPTKLENEQKLEGIIGLVASSLVEAFKRPAFVGVQCEKDGKPVIKVSGRNYGDLDIYNLVKENEKDFEGLLGYGGHAGAMGLTFSTIKSLKIFNYVLNNKAKVEYNVFDESYIRLPKDVNLQEVYETVKKLGPYGQGFEKPNFIIEAELFNYSAFSSIVKNFDAKIFGNSFKCKAFKPEIKFNDIVKRNIYFSFEDSKDGFELEVTKMEEVE